VTSEAKARHVSSSGTTEVGPGTARARAFGQLCLADARLFWREPEALFWTFVFPLLISIALGLAFREKPAEIVPVAVLAGPEAERLAERLRQNTSLKVSLKDEAEAAIDLRMGRVALVVAAQGEGVEYRLDPSRPDSALAQHLVDDALQREAGRRDPVPTRRTEVTEAGGRYVDFLLPGIMGMNLMSGGLWGVGFSLVDMRIKKLLKRLLATPMRRADFLAAQMTMRLAFVAVEIPFLLWMGHLLLGVPIRGSWGAIFLAGCIGSLTFGGIGLLLASRATRVETIMGLVNLVSMPMILCSGVFFAAERFPDLIQPVIRVLPLTALIDAMRAIVLEGASLASQAGRLALVGAWGTVGFLVGLRFFRWT
jgi:ABC-2 type transport system permease protein